MVAARFPTTRRSVVLALGSADAAERARAFDTLVAIYWKPLYKYARVAWNRTREDAEDLTQGFFARLYEKDSLSSYDRDKGGFRPFLRTLFDRYSANDNKARQRIKRGGGEIHVDFDAAEAEIGRDNAKAGSPHDYFEREWARSVFALAVERFRQSCAQRDRLRHFELFEAYDLDDKPTSYRELGERFGLSETTVTNHLAAARREFRETVLDALREATASDHEFRAEARALLGIEP
jgi:RNA polymerase sigma factor (sigma-70 family)